MKNEKDSIFYDISKDDYNLSSRDRGGSVLSKFSHTQDNVEKEKATIYEFKVIMLGNVAVGKTSIISRYVDNSFVDQYKCTLQTSFKTSSLNIDRKNIVNMKIWDTCGEEKYKSLTRQYYRDTHGIILIFDLTNMDSFSSLESWLAEIKKHGPKDYDLILIGNKADLEFQRAVTNEEVNFFAERENLTYLEVSAKNGTNVLLLFEKISEKMIKRNRELIETNGELKPNNNKSLSYSEGDLKRSSKAEQHLKRMEERDKGKKCC